MKRIRNFASVESAYLCASWLQDQGVNAEVVEENAMGGNFMANLIPGSVRIEVPDEEEQAALNVLDDYPVPDVYASAILDD